MSTFESLAQLASSTSSGPTAAAAAPAAAGHASPAAAAAAHASAAARAATRRTVAHRCRQLLAAMAPLAHDLRLLQVAAYADEQRTLYQQQQMHQQRGGRECKGAGDEQQVSAIASVGRKVGKAGASSGPVPSQPYPSSTDWLYVMDAYRTAVLQSGCTELYELAGIGMTGCEGAGEQGRGGAAGEGGGAMAGYVSPGVQQQQQQQQHEDEGRSNGESGALSALERFALVYRVNKKLIMWRWILAETGKRGA